LGKITCMIKCRPRIIPHLGLDRDFDELKSRPKEIPNSSKS
jgi:hypothetical protein